MPGQRSLRCSSLRTRHPKMLYHRSHCMSVKGISRQRCRPFSSASPLGVYVFSDYMDIRKRNPDSRPGTLRRKALKLSRNECSFLLAILTAMPWLLQCLEGYNQLCWVRSCFVALVRTQLYEDAILPPVKEDIRLDRLRLGFIPGTSRPVTRP